MMQRKLESIKYNLNTLYRGVNSIGSRVRNGKLNHKDAIDDLSRLLSDTIININEVVTLMCDMESKHLEKILERGNESE